MTNMIITPNQTRGECPEDPRFDDVYCQRDSDCKEGEAVANGNGMIRFFICFYMLTLRSVGNSPIILYCFVTIIYLF